MIDPNPIGKCEARSAAGRGIGEDRGYDLRSEGVEVVGGVGFEEGKKLIQRGAFGTGSDKAEKDMD